MKIRTYKDDYKHTRIDIMTTFCCNTMRHFCLDDYGIADIDASIQYDFDRKRNFLSIGCGMGNCWWRSIDKDAEVKFCPFCGDKIEII